MENEIKLSISKDLKWLDRDWSPGQTFNSSKNSVNSLIWIFLHFYIE